MSTILLALSLTLRVRFQHAKFYSRSSTAAVTGIATKIRVKDRTEFSHYALKILVDRSVFLVKLLARRTLYFE